jgi:hypothetical protein
MRRQQRAKGHHLKHERRRRYRALQSEVLTVQRQAAGTRGEVVGLRSGRWNRNCRPEPVAPESE